MSEPYLGEIKMFAGNFAPFGYAFCDGQLLAVSQNDALFSLLGTIYGGDGRTTFALPDLRGRAPVHAGQGPGLSNVRVGQAGGAESVALSPNQLPPHNHAVIATANLGSSTTAEGNVMGAKTRFGSNLFGPASNLVPLAPAAVGSEGGGQPHENVQPSTVVNFIIALAGIYPSRN